MTHYQPTLAEAKSYIYSVDLSSIVDKLVEREHWKRSDAMEACTLYRNYLFLQKKYADQSGRMPPSSDIDAVWHNHILDTQKYMQDCDKIFGSYLHHDPNLVMDGKPADNTAIQKLFETTQAYYFNEFGDYIYNVRKNRVKQFIRFMKLLFQKT